MEQDELSIKEDDRRVENQCTDWCLCQFQSDNIGLDYDKPPDFVTSQWSTKQKWYVLYRSLVGIVFLGWVIGDVAYETGEFNHGQIWRWFLFASNWSLTVLGFTAVFQAMTTCIYTVKPYWIMDPIYIRAMPTSLKVQWFFQNISYNSALVVTTAYWAFLAFVNNAPSLTSHMSRLKHTANSLFVIADILISATPIRVYHMFFTVFLGSLYAVFSALYYLNHGTILVQTDYLEGARTYYFMNWTQPVEAICTTVLAVLMCIIAQFVLHGLFLLRRQIHKRIDPNGLGQDSELQNIITGSSSYNTLDEERSVRTMLP